MPPKIRPPLLTPEKLIEYLNNRMLFRKEQFVMEPSTLLPQGGLFRDVCQQWQEEYIYRPIDARDAKGYPKYRLLYLQMPKKPLWIETPIITTEGWKLLKNIKKGDFVFNEQGQPVEVLGTTETFFNKKCYKVTFSDKTEIICSSDHLWFTYAHKIHNSIGSPKKIRRKKKVDNRTTEDIKNTLYVDQPYYKTNIKEVRRNHSIPVAKLLNFPERHLLIPPYTLGVWLGDGTSKDNTIIVSNDDLDILDGIREEGIVISQQKFTRNEKTRMYTIGFSGQGRKSPIRENLKYYNLLKNKHIPKEYLLSSIRQRLSLLQGLMDTDGCCSSLGLCIFATTNYQLAKNVLEIIRSLGLKSRIRKYISKGFNKVYGESYIISFMAHKNFPVFKLKRKFVRQKEIMKNKARSAFKQIIDIKETISVPVKCLIVDSDSHLFLAGDGLTITHNCGKTTLLGGEIVSQLLLNPYPTEENYLLGGDTDQATYIFNKVRDFIYRNPNFVDLFSIYKNEIVVNSTGAKVMVLSSEAKTKHGKAPDFFIFDEFWNQPSRDLWDSMWLGIAAKPNAQGIVISNAGYSTDTICYQIREMCRSGKFKNFYWFEPTGALLESLKMPWITEEWLEIERASTPPEVFNRFRKNLWVTAGDKPFMPEEGWECFKPHLFEKSMCSGHKHYVGLDIGLKKDAAAIVIVHREAKKIVVDRIMRWLGSKVNPVPIHELEEFLVMTCKNFEDPTLVVDPWQAMGIIQKFRRSGVEVLEYYLTIQNMVKMSKNLYYLFRNVAIDVPHHDKLEDELKGLQVVEKSYGWRIDHEKGNTSDISMALAMASVIAMEKGMYDLSEREIEDLYFIDNAEIYRSGGKRAYGIDAKKEDKDDDMPRMASSRRLF